MGYVYLLGKRAHNLFDINILGIANAVSES